MHTSILHMKCLKSLTSLSSLRRISMTSEPQIPTLYLLIRSWNLNRSCHRLHSRYIYIYNIYIRTLQLNRYQYLSIIHKHTHPMLHMLIHFAHKKKYHSSRRKSVYMSVDSLIKGPIRIQANRKQAYTHKHIHKLKYIQKMMLISANAIG